MTSGTTTIAAPMAMSGKTLTSVRVFNRPFLLNFRDRAIARAEADGDH